MTTKSKMGILSLPLYLRGNQDMSNLVAENALNPLKHHLSSEAKKRLRWMYVIEYECDGNISKAARRTGISREWLNTLHVLFEKHERDPRSLEPVSQRPHDCSKRQRISLKAEGLIVKERKKHSAWGKEKIARLLKRDHGISVSPSSVGRCLKKHGLVNLKLTLKNERAWRRRKMVGHGIKIRERFPHGLEDAGPGCLIGKDMKLLAKPGVSLPPTKERRKEGFWYQHSMIDACTRMRTISIVEEATSRAATEAFKEAQKHFPFSIASITSDNGGENDGVFDRYLSKENILHFWSRPGVPTDNPRVERGHLADDVEFHAFHPEIRSSLPALIKGVNGWEQIWNQKRPHQALGYLTPIEYLNLWKTDRKKAISIQKTWNAYLAKQSLRLHAARQEKKVEQIRELNYHLRTKVGTQFIPLKV